MNMQMDKKRFTVEFLTEFLGTVSKDPEIYRTYIESKKPETENHEDEYLTVEKVEEKGWQGFHRDDNGLFVYEYMIKGFLKHAGNVLKEQLKIKALRSKLDDFCFVYPRRIYLGQKDPDGIIERPLRAMTAQGPRVTLVRSDFIMAGKRIEFEIGLLSHKEIKWQVIEELFAYGEVSGLGQFRNGGYGRFAVVRD
jgi:hypothetical protein